MTILMNKFNQLRQINHWLTWSRIKIKKAPLNIHKKTEKKKKKRITGGNFTHKCLQINLKIQMKWIISLRKYNLLKLEN